MVGADVILPGWLGDQKSNTRTKVTVVRRGRNEHDDMVDAIQRKKRRRFSVSRCELMRVLRLKKS
jgi:hypothetical protein